eukprot:1850047-Pyramimonas_sp.AAC.1
MWRLCRQGRRQWLAAECDLSRRSHWRQWITTPSTLAQQHATGTEMHHLREHVCKWRWHSGTATAQSESIGH